ncbi:MAG: hypothetical protein KIT84_10765 [Labilithrix sp.]|nr:hypothetical protein [Labilithrix sp.]MCW5811488.1 hypothetical protein [Labilithrix sp.]
MIALRAVVAAGVLLVARDARADDASPYRLKWQYDAPLLALGLAGSMTSFIGHRSPRVIPAASRRRECSRSTKASSATTRGLRTGSRA